MNMFPKNIYQVWYQGCDNITRDEFKLNVQKWKQLNEEWNYFCVDNSFLENACKQFSDECYNVYKNLDVMHMKIDLGRYVLVYLNGGMYADMDAYILRPLDFSKKVQEIISTYEKDNKHVLGLSSVPLSKLETLVMTGRFHDVALNNAIMFSSPKNPVLKQFIEHVLERIKLDKNSVNYLKVQNTTGPMTFNTFFNNKINSQDNSRIIVFEPNIFEPCTMDQHCKINENTVALHLFESSWVLPYMKGIVGVYFFLKPYFPLIVLAIVWHFFSKKKGSNHSGGPASSK